MNLAKSMVLTGAAGFLGAALIEELKQAHVHQVINISRLVLLDAKALSIDVKDFPFEIESHLVDIRDKHLLISFLQDIDIVIHSASIIDWGNLPGQLLHDINVEGTRNVIQACRESQVSKLVYTSTMDVCYAGKAITNGDESLPYPERYEDAYCQTKAEAEKLVIAANDEQLITSVLRPCGIYGPADPYHIAESLKAVQSGALKVRVGDGSALFQHVYVGNVAYAHTLLVKAMLENNDDVAGQVYLVTDDPAENFFDFLAPIMLELGFPFPSEKRYIPFRVMYVIAFIAEYVIGFIKPFKSISSPITRSSVKMLCEDFTFKTDKAQRHFSYSPKYSKSHAFETTVNYFKKNLKEES